VKENKAGVIQLANTRHTWSDLSTLYFSSCTRMFSFSSFFKGKRKVGNRSQTSFMLVDFFENALTAVLCAPRVASLAFIFS